MPTPAKIKNVDLPTITFVGRVNVGKSTLFNRLIEKQKALVSNIPGTTRTRNEGEMIWRGKRVKIIDTGGLTFAYDIPLEEEIVEQSEKAMDEADVIVLVIDAQSGILPQEKELAKKLRKLKGKPIVLIANKVDNKKTENMLVSDPEWTKLGLGQPFLVSAVSGRGIGDFLDEIYKLLKSIKVTPKKIVDEELINISIIGKPNVGKSSLFNKIIGEEKVIVSEMPHTTREPFDILVSYEHKTGAKTKKYNLNFIDTAGIRRKAKVSGFLERIGITKSIEQVEKSDLVLFVIDGNEDISTQDRQLGGLLERRAKSVIILVNKWDLTDEKDDEHRNKAKKLVYSNFPHLKFAPILFVSGLTGYRTHDIFPEIIKIWDARNITIPNEALKAFLEQATKVHRPSRGKGTRHPKILGLEQVETNPPVFEMIIKHKTSLHRSYLNFLENKLREQFGFEGTPVIIKLRKSKV